MDSPAVFLEKSLVKWVHYLVIPVFAFANAGVQLGAVTFGSVSAGVILGLFVGKPLGIVGVSWFFDRINWVSIPPQVSWLHMIGLGCLAGIGFTMSLFIGSLAFENPLTFGEAKLSILIASALSGFLGTFILLSIRQKPTMK